MDTAADKPPMNTDGRPRKGVCPPHLEKHKWKKGAPSANPNGRPKKRTVQEELEALLDEPAPDGLDGESKLIYLLRAVIDRAIGGDSRATDEILARLAPRPKAPLDINLAHPELPLSDLVAMLGSAELLPIPDLHEMNAAGELVLRKMPAGELEAPEAEETEERDQA